MDTQRMLDKCVKQQWKVDDLDWSVTPRELTREEEVAVVQYFTDMAGIERLAAALFAEQRRRADDDRSAVLGEMLDGISRRVRCSLNGLRNRFEQ